MITGPKGDARPATGRRPPRWRVVLLVAVAAVLVVAAGLAGRSWWTDDEEGTVATDAVIGGTAGPQVTRADLEQVARTRVFFGHQSVGFNILSGIPAVFAAHGVAAPTVHHGRAVPDPAPSGGFLLDAPIGANTDPLAKIRDFDALIRGGLGRQVDVAVMKLCYIDIVPGTDVDAVFAAYRDTLAALEKDFPGVRFVAATVPLTTRPSPPARLKQAVTGNDAYGARANAARERLNELIRRQYAGAHLFDLAAVESTAPDGTRVSGRSGGRPYFALHGGYAADSGHLNDDGSRRAASAWLAAVARACAG